jgi:3-hydroxyisobutyrate dehydrogenase-like beta-hydroxyacid dehydrogenase
MPHRRRRSSTSGRSSGFTSAPWEARRKQSWSPTWCLNRAVLAEGLNLAQRAGLDPAAMLAVLRSGLAYSRVMDTKGRKMLESDFSPEARLRQHHKDVRLILELGAACGARVPLSELHDLLLSRAAELGFADADNSAIIRAFQEQA